MDGTGFTDCADGQFRILRGSDLARNEDIQRKPETKTELQADHHATARDGQNQSGWIILVPAERKDEVLPCLDTISEHTIPLKSIRSHTLRIARVKGSSLDHPSVDRLRQRPPSETCTGILLGVLSCLRRTQRQPSP